MLVMGYIPCASQQEAERIGQTLVAEKTVACANVVPKIHSFFHWNGQNQSQDESLLLVKTLLHRVPAVQKRVKELHSYAVPCIAFYKAESVNAEYLQWVQSVLE